MLWYKALHLIFMVTWFSGLFYLPRLFVYHAMSDDKISIDRFKVMEKKLFYGIATPGGLLTIIFGFCLLVNNGMTMLIVTHELGFASKFGDRIVFMDGGEIIEEGIPKKILKTPKTQRLKMFLEKLNITSFKQ